VNALGRRIVHTSIGAICDRGVPGALTVVWSSGSI
jgi:hypothetical protein